MLCPSAPKSCKLPQKEVWTHQQPAPKEEAEVNHCRDSIVNFFGKILSLIINKQRQYFIVSMTSLLSTKIMKLRLFLPHSHSWLCRYCFHPGWAGGRMGGGCLFYDTLSQRTGQCYIWVEIFSPQTTLFS